EGRYTAESSLKTLTNGIVLVPQGKFKAGLETFLPAKTVYDKSIAPYTAATQATFRERGVSMAAIGAAAPQTQASPKVTPQVSPAVPANVIPFEAPQQPSGNIAPAATPVATPAQVLPLVARGPPQSTE